MTTNSATAPPVGSLLKEWRTRRSRSQLDLALEVGVSSRHLSFVETGRSRPSPELVLALAEHLDVPLRERNQLLLAAGFAPRYRRTALDDRSMARVRAALEGMLAAHEPYPGLVIDRSWNVVMANRAATALTAALPAHLTGPPLNVFRASLHPDGLAAVTVNLDQWATYLLSRLHRVAADAGGDPEVRALVDEVTAYPAVAGLGDWRRRAEGADPPVVVPWIAEMGGRRLSLWTTITTFGTPQDVTLDELAVELFYPSDDETEEILRSP